MPATPVIQKEEAVEVFLNAEPNNTGNISPKPLILPSNATSKITAAQRRWNLLKNLKTVSRRPTSLTKSEEAFLQNFKKIPKGKQQDDAEEDGRLQQARQDLKAAIESHSHALTEREVAFLTQLADSQNASAQHLEQSTQVLNQDPLFLKAEKKDNNAPKEERVSKEAVKTLSQQGPSFRTEVWTQFKAVSPNGGGSVSSSEESKDEKKEDESIQPVKQKSTFYKILFRQPKEQKQFVKEEEVAPDSDVIEFSILATSVQDLDCHPHVLSPPIMDALRMHLPLSVQFDNFWLKYSMVRDGASIRALLQKVRSSSRTVLAIETMDGDVFGAFTSSPWRPKGHTFYGSCEAFLWRMSKSRYTKCDTVEEALSLENDIDVFPWSGKNRNIQFLATADDQLIVGGGASDNDDDDDPHSNNDEEAGSALVIRADMFHGFSDPCVTFDCPGLLTASGKETSFKILNLEVWALTPVGDVQMAEKLELGRQFVFDHGNFVEN